MSPSNIRRHPRLFDRAVILQQHLDAQYQVLDQHLEALQTALDAKQSLPSMAGIFEATLDDLGRLDDLMVELSRIMQTYLDTGAGIDTVIDGAVRQQIALLHQDRGALSRPRRLILSLMGRDAR